MSSTVSKKRYTICVLLLLCIFAVGFGGWRVWRQVRLRNFGVVKEGVLYRCGQPYEKQFEELIKRYGFKTIINVRSELEPYEEEIAKKHGLNLINAPVQYSEPLSEEQISQFLSIVDDPKMQPVLVHCSEGRIRTGAVIALYRRRRSGWSREQTVEEMKRYDFDFSEKHKPLIESVLSDIKEPRKL